MLQGEQREPEDFVLATGETYKVRTFVELAFKEIGVEIKWKGKGTDEIGYDAKDESRVLVRIDPRYFRPTEVDILIGDPSKAEKKLGWKRNTTFKQLVKGLWLIVGW